MFETIHYKNLKKTQFRKIIRNILQKTTTIFIVSYEDELYKLPKLGELNNSIPECISKGCYIIKDIPQKICFQVSYYDAYESFTEFDTFFGFLDFYSIHRIWFLENDNVIAYSSVEEGFLKYMV